MEFGIGIGSGVGCEFGIEIGGELQVKIFCGQDKGVDPPGETRKASQRCRTHFVCELRFLPVVEPHLHDPPPDMVDSSVSWLTSNLRDFLLGQISMLLLRHLLLSGKTHLKYKIHIAI